VPSVLFPEIKWVHIAVYVIFNHYFPPMNIVGEEKISKLKDEIARARSSKHKCSLLIDLAMELRNTDPGSSLITSM
jgi:hypothetical protein